MNSTNRSGNTPVNWLHYPETLPCASEIAEPTRMRTNTNVNIVLTPETGCVHTKKIATKHTRIFHGSKLVQSKYRMIRYFLNYRCKKNEP